MSVAMETRPNETKTGLDQLAYCSRIVRTGPYHHAPGSGMPPLPVLNEFVAIDVPQVAIPDAFGPRLNVGAHRPDGVEVVQANAG